MVRLPHKLHCQLDLRPVSATRPVGLVSGLDNSHLCPAIGRPALLATIIPLRVFVTSAQMSAMVRARAAAPPASGLVHIGNHQVSRQRSLRRACWAEPHLNAPRKTHALPESLAASGASR